MFQLDNNNNNNKNINNINNNNNISIQLLKHTITLVLTLQSLLKYQIITGIIIATVWLLLSPLFPGCFRTTPSVWPTPSRLASRASAAPNDRRSPGPPLARRSGASGAAGIENGWFLPWKNSENCFLLSLKMMVNGSFTRKKRNKW